MKIQLQMPSLATLTVLSLMLYLSRRLFSGMMYEKYHKMIILCSKLPDNNRLQRPYMKHNVLCFYKQRVVVPYTIHSQLLKEFHDNKMTGHFGVLRTFKRLTHQFCRPSMYHSIQEYIKQCEVCQKTKTEALALLGLIQPLHIPCQVQDDITLDFIEGLLSSHGKDSLLVDVVRFNKYAHFIALSHIFSIKIIPKRFIEYVVKLHGTLKSIINDRDPIFIIKFWQE